MMKSRAPARIEATAILTPLWPVTTTTAAVGSRPRMSLSRARPSAPVLARAEKFMSSRITSTGSDASTLQASAASWAATIRIPRRRSKRSALIRTSGSSSMNSTVAGRLDWMTDMEIHTLDACKAPAALTKVKPKDDLGAAGAAGRETKP